MRGCVLSWALVLFGLAAGSAFAQKAPQTSNAGASTAPEMRLLQGLRDRGYYDLSVDYINSLRKDSATPPELKPVLDYEEARSLLDEALKAVDLVQRRQKLDVARTKVDAFVKANPNHPLASEAYLELARLLFARGETAALQSDEAEQPAAKQTKMAEARESYDGARKAYAAAEAPLKKEYEKYPKYVAEGDPRRTVRDRAHIALMNAELQRTLVDYHEAQTYPFGSKERNDLLGRGEKGFEDVYRRYRTQLAGLYARMWQAKCYEEEGKLTEAMGIYKELMEHQDPQLKPLQQRVEFFQIIVDGKRKEHALAIDRASDWLKRYPNADRTLVVGVKFETAKNLLALIGQGETSQADKDIATRRAADFLDDVTRVVSPYKADAIALRQKVKPRGNLTPAMIAGLTYEDAYAQGEAAQGNHEWDRAAALFRQAVRKADPVRDADKANRARHMLAFCLYEGRAYYEADVMAEHLARHYPKFNLSPKAAEIGIAALIAAYNGYTKQDQKADLDRLIDLCHYTAETWPDTEQADSAWNILGEIEIGRGNYAESAKAFDAIRTSSPIRLDSQVRAGDAHWRSAEQLRARGKDAESDAEVKAATDTLKAALAARKSANVQPTETGYINNVKALAEIERVSGRAKESLELLEPLTAKLATSQRTPELSQQLAALLSMQLRAHVANGDAEKAIADMKALEASGGASTGRTQLYLELGRSLKRELEAEQAKKYTTNLNKIRTAYGQFVRALAGSKSDQTFESLLFAADALLPLSQPPENAEAKEAVAIYDQILSNAELTKTDGRPDPKKIVYVQVQKAKALGKAGKFPEAEGLFEKLGNDPENKGYTRLLTVERANLYEEWGKLDKSKWQNAYNLWKRVAVTLDRRKPKPIEYYDATYHIALCLRGLGRKSEAAATLKSVMTLSPAVGNPEMKAKYEALLRELSH